VTAVKRGLYTVKENLVVKKIGNLVKADSEHLENSLKYWLGISAD
jgi:mRNA interferase MazF